MKSLDYRNATYHGLRGQLEGLRLRVYEAWIAHGPMTTRQLAAQCGIDLLTLRPRTTELLQLGLIEVVDEPVERTSNVENEIGETIATVTTTDPLPPGEGVYRAVTQDKWNHWREGMVSHQMQLI